MDSHARPRVSVIIPAFNAAHTLPALFDCLERQTWQPAEILVVDDCSRDETSDIARTHGAKVIRLPENSGPGTARNAGVYQASGDVVMFTDADCLLPTDWIERSLEFMRERGARLTTSGYLGPVDSDLNSWFQHWEKRSREPFEARAIQATNGHSLAIERSLYLAAGGMERMRTSEDFLFGIVVSEHAAVYYDPGNGVYHRFRPGLMKYFRQKMLFAQNSILCSRKKRLKMSASATFSPWKTIAEISLTVGSIGLVGGAIFFRVIGNSPDWKVCLSGAFLFLAMRTIPFIVFLRRQSGIEHPRWGAIRSEPRSTVPRLLYLYSLPWLLVRDIATCWGILRGGVLLLMQ